LGIHQRCFGQSFLTITRMVDPPGFLYLQSRFSSSLLLVSFRRGVRNKTGVLRGNKLLRERSQGF
jgi:hypothetical protein